MFLARFTHLAVRLCQGCVGERIPSGPMCSHYQSIKEAARLEKYFGVPPPAAPVVHDVWPGYSATFIRAGEGGARTRHAGRFGLVPHWAADATMGRKTYNARSETVTEKPAYRDAWARAQHCIIPAECFFEPDWRSGRALPAAIRLANGAPMGIAGLWAQWRDPAGDLVQSFTMLTINADDHAFMRQFHRPEDEKRGVVILPPDRWDDWLAADAANSVPFLIPFPAQDLVATVDAPPPAPRTLSLFD